MILLDSFLPPPSPRAKRKTQMGHNYKIDFILINFKFYRKINDYCFSCLVRCLSKHSIWKCAICASLIILINYVIEKVSRYFYR